MEQIGEDPQYGFLYFISDDVGEVELYYFEERNKEEDRYDEIYDCVGGEGGIESCLGLADRWL